MKNLYPYLIESAEEAARVARGVTAEQLPAPTPCKEFDTRALLNHWILYTSHGLEHRARRTQLPEALTGRDFTDAPDWAEAYAAQLRRAVDAWSEPAVWEGEIDLGGTLLPVPSVVALLLTETVLHGWDVARATGQEFHCSQGLAELILATVGEHAETYRRYEGFAAPVPLPDSASSIERALATSGRDPHWRS
ncbi:TIGR03086 family metal-binding protein [Kitasatospora sp. NPDC050543]|uniref:TIGR03086 family metal-binding protein n=1 Tax=Kitasatospora sp. NPDC050543 TaxID=3364054 RepID=UPI00378CEB43